METITAPLGVQPAAENSTVAPAGEQPATNHLETIGQLSPADALAILEGGIPDSTPTPTPLATPPEAIPAAVVEPVAGEQPPTDPPADGSKAPQRLSVRFLEAEQQKEMAAALDLVRTHKAIDVFDAFKQLRGTSVSTPAAGQPEDVVPQAVQPPAVVSPPVPEVAAIEATIADLSAQRDAAEDNYERDEVRRLNAEIREQDRLLVRAEIAAQSSQQSLTAWRADYLATVDAMEQAYPDGADPDSVFYKLLDYEVSQAEARNDPALKNPDYLMGFAEQVANQLKVAPVERAAIPQRPADPAVTGRSVAPINHPAPRHNSATLDALIKSATPAEILDVIS